ncbi:hypothetical protein [Desulforamulus ferrireducens]|uniref:Uncharacterized protein n=1 Tax=Desulforamulus ferrireducens TaxID=1833852 RepID=A0A1S6IVJ1_9FIRM|nr:hypothetical protein [Desulforamulus ferrireducens]AQS58782.1 hypothetical protein B0537_06620 [Desulforamulus ferrireducens]
MQDPINKIWDMVDEVVEENLELFLEDELEGKDWASNFESILEDSSDDVNYEEEFGETNHSATEDDWDEPQDKDMDYWLNEFENILEEEKPPTLQGAEPSQSRLPLLLGGGGIILLGLVTSVTVLVRLKKGRRFYALPVVEEEPVEVEAEVPPTEPAAKKIPPVPLLQGPLFMLNQLAQCLLGPFMGPLTGGRHEKHDHPIGLRG